MAARLWGVFGRPVIDLEPYVDTAKFAAIDREITAALSLVDSEYTGGTLKRMGVVAPWMMRDGYLDAMDAIDAMTEREYRDFIALGEYEDEPALPYERRGEGFGDETDRPFSRAQQRLLAYRHGVYFPWKVCYHLLSNDRWEDKHSGEGKTFSDEAREHFAETVALIEALPFNEIGRVVVFGLEPNDHAPLHRDSEPGQSESVAQCVMLSPRGQKRFYLQNAKDDEPYVVKPRAYWFNDMDYHGVLADPVFRYSIRVDGVFDPAFVRQVARG
ncbi:MAG: hypothetical protein JNK05_16815 [Myxococcales bacterium]|nr:hypothetical protein [Myxococcales bacterium]